MTARFVRFWLPDFDSPNRAYVASQVVGYTPFLILFLVGLPVWRGSRGSEQQLWAPTCFCSPPS